MISEVLEGVDVKEDILQGMNQFSPELQADKGIALWPELLIIGWKKYLIFSIFHINLLRVKMIEINTKYFMI
ncbi:hypothetical protein [Clostridium diolis]|uniref:hypothetical protein n=1 Tax=Clostridium diolis TaxID=223919 RepID=UPI003AF88DE9